MNPWTPAEETKESDKSAKCWMPGCGKTVLANEMINGLCIDCHKYLKKPRENQKT